MRTYFWLAFFAGVLAGLCAGVPFGAWMVAT